MTIKEARFFKARSSLLKWHELYGRDHLPWRKNASPYAVLVSEFMLQQTTVATVAPRFAQWMSLFPTLSDLASATEEQVLSAWQGLGYYSRARRLHAAAKEIMERYVGIIPVEQEELLSLPGVGAYTAAALRAFAHDLHALVLDTNIIRVLSRWSNLTTPIDTSLGKNTLDAIARQFYPQNGCRQMASALMDLGATICISGTPDCAACPLKVTCLAEQPSQLPRKAPRKVTQKRSEYRLWFYDNDKGLLYLEHSQGPRWRNLWILPELEGHQPKGRALAEITYPITRYRITMKVYRAKGSPPPQLHGFTREKLALLPMPSPHRRGITRIFSSTCGSG